MKNTVRVAALGLALSAFVQHAGAIGFGRLPASTTIGQPLDLAIPIRLEPGESLTSDCVNAQVAFADSPQQPGTTSVRLDPALPDATERILRLHTTTRVDEPIVTVELTLGCGSRISRQFTLFADPPLVSAAAPPELPPPVAAASAASEPPRVGDVTVPPATVAAPRRPRRADAAPRRPAVATARSASPAPRAAGSAPARTAGGSRLRLAPLEADTVVARARAAPGAPAASAPAAAGSAAPGAMDASAPATAAAVAEAASAASAARAAEAAANARAAELERELQRVRADSASAQQAIAALRADLDRLREQGGGERPWWTDALVLALVLALAALLWLWRQRQQDREAGEWMSADAATVAPDHGPEFDEPPTEASVSQTPALSSKVLLEEEPDDGGPASRTGPITMPMPAGSPAAPVEPKREVSVEELIDLEQQAEFFVVLGQDEAAIDLLMGHLRSTSGTSPLPYLKLLEIYKRRGERKPYELLRERFNGRFSAIAPAWDTDWQTGRSLEDYPAVLERLQSLWYSPARAMEVLQATLMRPAGSEHEPPGSRSVGFDLPAYRELMFLYAIARDRAETETGGGAVDLLLPLGEPDTPGTPLVFERLMATTSLEAQPSVRQPLTIDLPVEESPTTTAAAAMFNGPAVDFDPSELPPLEPLPPRRES